MNRKYVTALTGYMVWVNSTVREWLGQISEEQWTQTIPSSFSSIRQTVLHIVSAEKIWLDFWQRVPDPVFLSQEFDGSRQELLAAWTETSAALQQFMTTYPEQDYTRTVIFKIRDEEWQMEFWQTFSHFINHATYHRGQLVTLLRQAGFRHFSSTDLATYYRVHV